MESTCVVSRTLGDPVVNADGSTTPNTQTIYTGICKLRFPSIRAEVVLVEGQNLVKDKGILSLPVLGDSANIRADDVAVVTLSPTLDPGTVVTVRIETPFTQTFSTARRFPAEVIN